jgi:endoglucanase Acf2
MLVCVLPGLLDAAPLAKTVGAGSYLGGLPDGVKGPGAAPRVPKDWKGPVPTTDWWSALVWSEKSFPQFPHPLAVAPHDAGLRVAYPGARLRTLPKDIMGGMPGGLEDLVIGHSAVEKFGPPSLDKCSDWFVTLRFADGDPQLLASYGHGSPFVFCRFAGGHARLRFPAPPKVWSGDAQRPALGVTVNGRHYGLFGPQGATWTGLGTNTVECRSGGRDYFAVAVLPDDGEQTLARFQRYAHAPITDTRVEWAFDEKTSRVTTRFVVTTEPREGTERGTLLALYPHQWRHTSAALLEGTFASVRGPMRLVAGRSFETPLTFPGILPVFPDAGGVNQDAMARLLEQDAGPDAREFRDTYWEGKHLGKLATLTALAQIYGLESRAAALREQIRARLEDWFTATGVDGQPKTRGVFAYEPRWGTLIGYPASYGTDDQLNDHHFHYGYFLRAAAELALNDPDWAKPNHWGGMIQMLARDIASPDRRDPLFPFLRCFDPFAGHSWASGSAKFGDGNNQESSSESLNAWSALVLLGEATGDRALRDLGVWLFTTELYAVEEYWFDVHRSNFPREFERPCLGIVWGGKGSYATWFSGAPEAVHGINWLPFTGASICLGRFPDCAARNYSAIVAARGGTHFQMWPDLMWMYRALSDPNDARNLLEAAGESWRPEAGNSRANVRHWILNLQKLGQADRTVTANTPFRTVFNDGKDRAYCAHNAGRSSRRVIFSDGMQMDVPPGQTAVKRR